MTPEEPRSIIALRNEIKRIDMDLLEERRKLDTYRKNLEGAKTYIDLFERQKKEIQLAIAHLKELHEDSAIEGQERG